MKIKVGRGRPSLTPPPLSTPVQTPNKMLRHGPYTVHANPCHVAYKEIQTNAFCKQDFHVGIFVPVRLLDRETVQGKLSVC